jgi:hypothetical protein
VAADIGLVSVAKAMMLFGADVTSVDKARASGNSGTLPSFDACADAHRQGGWTPLMRAAHNGHTGVAAYLIDKGAALEAKDEVRAALTCTSLLWLLTPCTWSRTGGQR